MCMKGEEIPKNYSFQARDGLGVAEGGCAHMWYFKPYGMHRRTNGLVYLGKVSWVFPNHLPNDNHLNQSVSLIHCVIHSFIQQTYYDAHIQRLIKQSLSSECLQSCLLGPHPFMNEFNSCLSCLHRSPPWEDSAVPFSCF